MRFQAINHGERAIELGLDAIDLFAVEEYANALRASDLGHESLRPVMSNVVVDKLVRQLEASIKEGKDAKTQLIEVEAKLADADKEVLQMESAMLELSKALVENGLSQSDESQNDFSEVKLLLAILQSKVTGDNPKVIEAIQNLESSKANLQLKKEISKIRRECEQLKKKAEMNYFDPQNKNQAIESLGSNLQQTSSHKKSAQSLINSNEFLASNSMGISSLLEQLIDCVEELTGKEELIEQNNLKLHEYAAKFVPLCVKARLIYKDLANTRKAHCEEILNLKNETEHLAGCNSDLKHEVSRLEEIVQKLELEPESLKMKYVESQRKLIVCEVNEKALIRRMTACESAEKSIFKEKQRLKDDISELDGTARQTISRLYRHKKEAESFANEMSEKWSESVSLKEHKLLQNKLAMYISKTKLLLERERDFIEVQTSNEAYRLEAHDLQNVVFQLELKVKEYEMKALKFEEFVKASKNSDDYVADKYWRPKFDSLSVKAEILQQRAEISEQKVHALQQLENSVWISVKIR